MQQIKIIAKLNLSFFIFACYFLIIKIVTKSKQQYILQQYSKNRPHNYGSNSTNIGHNKCRMCLVMLMIRPIRVATN